MRLIVATILLFALFPVGLNQVAQKPAQAGKDEQDLRQIEDEWLGCYLRGDKATFDRIVADDFTATDESAIVRNKMHAREHRKTDG